MLSLTIKEESPHQILLVKGEIDASNSVQLDESIRGLAEKGAKSILVDGSELEYISSAGLGVFMSYLEEFQEKEIQLKIFSLTPKVFEVFRILGLDQLISIVPTKAEAIQES